MFGLATTVMGGAVIEPALIAKWFVRHRGRAMAVAMMGISAGGVVIAPWAGWLVDTIGWRAAWVALGITIFVLLTLPALIFVRRSPEDLGLKPDGVNDNDRENTSINVDSPNSDSYLEYPWTLREATRTKALWLLLCVHMFGGLAWRPIIIHQVAYIQDKGLGLSTATSVATAIALFQ